jgi:hypothetical protein
MTVIEGENVLLVDLVGDCSFPATVADQLTITISKNCVDPVDFTVDKDSYCKGFLYLSGTITGLDKGWFDYELKDGVDILKSGKLYSKG